jgi:hypothetical protein
MSILSALVHERDRRQPRPRCPSLGVDLLQLTQRLGCKGAHLLEQPAYVRLAGEQPLSLAPPVAALLLASRGACPRESPI